VDRHVEVLADFPHRVVLGVVVGVVAAPPRRKDDSPQSVFVCPADALDRAVDVPEHRDAGESDSAFGCGLGELRHPAVVRDAAGPLEVGGRALGPHRETRAERRCVHLGDAVREQHLGCDAVCVEDFVARFGVPCTREFVLVALAPFAVDVGDEETLRGFLGDLDLDGQRDVEHLAKFGIDVVAVFGCVRARMAIGRNDEVAIHFSLLWPSEPCRPDWSRTGAPTCGSRRGNGRPRRRPGSHGAPCASRCRSPVRCRR